MDESWLDPIEKRLEEALKTASSARLPQPIPNTWTPQESEQFWNSLHDLLMRRFNPFLTQEEQNKPLGLHD